MKFTNCNRLRIAVVALALALAGCASTGYHYSQILGERYFKTNIDTYPVIISRIDGKSPMTVPPALVEPGKRTVRVQGPPTATNSGEFRTIDIEVKPCTRYYLVAQKPSRLDNDFTVKIDHEEPVPGCTPPPAN